MDGSSVLGEIGVPEEEAVFLGEYDFDGDPEELLDGYRRLVAGFPPGALSLHVCVMRNDGLTVFDACPSRTVFAAFSTGPMFTSAVQSAGLPVPRITPLGEVKNAVMAPGILESQG